MSERWTNVDERLVSGSRSGTCRYLFSRALSLILLLIPGVAGAEKQPDVASCVGFERPSGTGVRVALEPVFPAATVIHPTVAIQSPADPHVWFVASRLGAISRIADNGASQMDVLSLQARVDMTEEGGLLGLALHPDFPRTAQIFASYTTSGVDRSEPFRLVLSRFRYGGDAAAIDPGTEDVLLVVPQPSSTHNGGGIGFGPDGMLYIGLGDGGMWNQNQTSQDPNTLLGSILRIDVDRGEPYAIPGDNPFVSGGAPEVWAYGFRNAYRWAFDPETGEMWAADVGASHWEEINRVERGKNYGWPVREGARCIYPACNGEHLTDPVVEYSHAAGCAVIGGAVYRGSALPDLNGAFVYGDFCSRRVWAASPTPAGDHDVLELLTSPSTFLGFGQDASGEILVLNLDGIARIVPVGSDPGPVLPDKLSKTGCVDPGAPFRAAAGLVPYALNEVSWWNGSRKRHWMALPGGTRIGLFDNGRLVLPAGAVLMQTLSMGETLVETRLLVRHGGGGWAGYSYEWNDEGTEATLLSSSRERQIQGVTWRFPGRDECMACHTFTAGYTLGLDLAQLNRASVAGGENQLEFLERSHLLEKPLPARPTALPRLSRDSLDRAARSYLHANCAHCHQVPYGVPRNIDLQHATSAQDLRICNVMPAYLNMLYPENARLLAPGDPERSAISIRMHEPGPRKMPPMGRSRPDIAGVKLIDEWISAWKHCEHPPDVP